MMAKEILILGAGFGGLEAATGLRQGLDSSYRVTLIDKSDYFIIGFSKFEVLFGRQTAHGVKSFYRDLAQDGVNFVQDTIELIDPNTRIVRTSRATYNYDYLVVALGAELAPELTPGFVEGGYEFYSLEGAAKLYPVLEEFSAGTILLSILGQPYKCPPAPYEAAFQLHDFFTRQGRRKTIDIKMLIPAPAPLAVAEGAADEVWRRFGERGIELLTPHKVTGLDPLAKKAQIAGLADMAYDLFIGVPVHRPPKVIRESALGNGSWVKVNRDTLVTNYDNVFAVGDVTSIPVGDLSVPKAGAFAEEAAKVVVANLLYRLTGQGQPLKFDAIGTCFLEFGDDQVAQISANYLGQAEPDVALEGPSEELREGKKQFHDDRIKRWFKPTS